MPSLRSEPIMANAVNEIEYIMENVSTRGYIDTPSDYDAYAILRTRKEYRDLISTELYEAYFLPDRHEFDWAILHRIVGFVTNIKTIEFIEQSLVSGVVGNMAYDVIKTILRTIVKKAKKNKMDRTRWEPYTEIIVSLEKIEQFFNMHESSRIRDMEDHTGLPREKIYPLLKLLGCRHYRRTEKTCLWFKPITQNHIS